MVNYYYRWGREGTGGTGAEEEKRNAEGTRAVGTAVDHEEKEKQQAHQGP
jgi:hypothetical protein